MREGRFPGATRILQWVHALYRTRYVHFFIVGATGVALNLVLTAFFAELVFGRAQYFAAFLIGLGANLLYNFVLHTVVTFKTSTNHARRLVVFIAYSLMMAGIQSYTIKQLTDWIGVDWYIPIIALVILICSVITFLLFKFVLFKDTVELPSRKEDYGIVPP